MWNKALDKEVSSFQEQAQQVRSWDRMLRQNGMLNDWCCCSLLSFKEPCSVQLLKNSQLSMCELGRNILSLTKNVEDLSRRQRSLDSQLDTIGKKQEDLDKTLRQLQQKVEQKWGQEQENHITKPADEEREKAYRVCSCWELAFVFFVVRVQNGFAVVSCQDSPTVFDC